LLERGAREVVGLEAEPGVCDRARANLSTAICGDVERLAIEFEPGHFDCLILADVLEHLRDPAGTLARLYRYLRPGGTVVASIPNVRHYSVLHMLVEGAWTYQPHGIMDRTRGVKSRHSSRARVSRSTPCRPTWIRRSTR
jgi:2-polyprenyl-3-methyl-5-hydroxy-6-metoxy-1,4-benzoquinol methylase